MHWRFFSGTLFSVLLASACTDLSNEELRKRSRDTIQAKETAEQVEITYTDSGSLKARLQAPLMIAVKQAKEPYMEMPKGLKGTFYGNDGAVESYLSSEYAISYNESKKVILRRNVEVMNVKGERLNTEELYWDQKSGKIHTDKFVQITTAEQIIMGDGMTANQTFTEWEINRYRGTINLQNDSTTNKRNSLDSAHRNNRR
ncbi:MAG: LPS export ABC transporter periplasmic protein LptC [Bacteroidota bacterium]